MRINKIIASGLGTGYAPVAPGTVGSLFGIMVLYGFNWLMVGIDLKFINILALNLFAIIFITLFGVHSIKKVHREWSHDASKIVIDEVAGVWIAAFAIPFQWQYFLYAFIFFRFFDIAKPLFIRRLDRLKSSWSVMLDDLLAGVYANLLLQILLHFKVI